MVHNCSGRGRIRIVSYWLLNYWLNHWLRRNSLISCGLLNNNAWCFNYINSFVFVIRIRVWTSWVRWTRWSTLFRISSSFNHARCLWGRRSLSSSFYHTWCCSFTWNLLKNSKNKQNFWSFHFWNWPIIGWWWLCFCWFNYFSILILFSRSRSFSCFMNFRHFI